MLSSTKDGTNSPADSCVYGNPRECSCNCEHNMDTVNTAQATPNHHYDYQNAGQPKPNHHNHQLYSPIVITNRHEGPVLRDRLHIHSTVLGKHFSNLKHTTRQLGRSPHQFTNCTNLCDIYEYKTKASTCDMLYD